MSTVSDFSIPELPPMSPGSSVSTRLQDEYDELLKFAVVVPKYDPHQMPQTLTDVRESFLQASSASAPRRYMTNDSRQFDDDELSEATDVTPINTGRSQDSERKSQRETLPDFGGQSPIRNQPLTTVDDHDNRPHDPIPSHYFSHQLSRNSNSDPKLDTREAVQGEYERVYTATVDPDIAKMETTMDQWCLDLKRNVLAEFSQSKIRIVEQGRAQLIREQERHASDKMKLLEEMSSLKELLATYEKSIDRKDQVISNLTHALQKQKDKTEMMRTFCEWKLKHNDMKRERFCSMLAKQHHERCLSRKVWDAWHSVIETKWHVRIEKACQAKAQEVCVQLTQDYEAKLSTVTDELEAARQEVAHMQKERERYEEMMKKAFMRGVCALNVEAMTIFHNNEEKENRDIGSNGHLSDEMSGNMETSLPEKDYNYPKTLPSHPIQHERIVTSEGSRPSTNTQPKPMSSKSKPSNTISSSKVLTTKTTSKVDSGRSRGKAGSHGTALAPPMSSVIVERHQPVNKQTMPHALAGKYPCPNTAPSGEKSRKVAGQGHLNIHTVKHVE